MNATVYQITKIDSLRYELAVELENQLSEKHAVTFHKVCAQLPTYTEVGMASLMPDAEKALSLVNKDGKLVTTLGGAVASTPSARFAYLKSKKGDLCEDIELDDLVRSGKKFKLADKTRLLIVRSREIDAIAHESHPHRIIANGFWDPRNGEPRLEQLERDAKTCNWKPILTKASPCADSMSSSGEESLPAWARKTWPSRPLPARRW